MSFVSPDQILSDATRRDIVRSRTRESATAIAKRLGIKRNTVLSVWNRSAEVRAARRETKPAFATIAVVKGLHSVSLPRLKSLEAQS